MRECFEVTVTLSNSADEEAVKRGLIDKDDVRSVTVTARVDPSPDFLIINEEVRAALGLEPGSSEEIEIEDGRIVDCYMIDPVTFSWKILENTVNAVFVPEAKEVVLGRFCFEALDVQPDYENKRLIRRYEDTIVGKPYHYIMGF
ncbi:MAG: hypothetical protein LBC77_08400 [Spirochaetaceae bacterium]|jgi:hypothetical protein|nr:hypothetical protein [Spirochaetaceae bacterium]